MSDASHVMGTGAYSSRSAANSARRDELLRRIEAAWPPRAWGREIAGLPEVVVSTLGIGLRSGGLSRAAAHLDRVMPGWTEMAARAVADAAPDRLGEALQRACALLARRPLRRPETLLRGLDLTSPDGDSHFWLLVALTGTDSSSVRRAWLSHLRAWVRSESQKPSRAAWFAFVRALLGGWLTWQDFRDCLVGGRVLRFAVDKRGYRRALQRLGLWSHPLFAKWYRHVVYEIANQPDAPLSFEDTGWIRDFPGEEYLWDALASLSDSLSWWPLHVLRWISEVTADDDRVVNRLRRTSPSILCLLSLVRGDFCHAVGRALEAPHHVSVVRWLKQAGPTQALDVEWIREVVAPWAEVAGEPFLQAAGALCSLEPPPDFAGPATEALRRRAFLRDHLLLNPDRLVDNLLYLYGVQKQHFTVVLGQARKGRPAAARALALWPEKAEETVPVLFHLARSSTSLGRQAARESLDILARRIGVDDLERLEKRVDLASAWADGGLEGRAARVWWDIGGYHIRLSVGGGTVQVRAYSKTRALAAIPAKVRQDNQYEEVCQARAQLAAGYRYFRRRFEQAMVDGVGYEPGEFTLLLANPVVRSQVARLVITVDGTAFLWCPPDPLGECQLPSEFTAAHTISIAHPLALLGLGVLEHWQQQIIECRVAQPFKQAFREVYLVGEAESELTECTRFASQRLVPRRAFALLRGRGYTPRRGVAVKDWPQLGLRAHLQWASSEEDAGRLLSAEPAVGSVTSGPIWFETDREERVPLGAIPPILFSETSRDADLLVSRAAAGELGFTSEETRRLRGTLVRYLTRALGLACVFVSEDCTHAIVEGRLAVYRVHLGSGSVLLEKTRRSVSLGGVRAQPVEAVVGEGVDEGTARIIGTVVALCRDEQITDPDFLRQLSAMA